MRPICFLWGLTLLSACGLCEPTNEPNWPVTVTVAESEDCPTGKAAVSAIEAVEGDFEEITSGPEVVHVTALCCLQGTIECEPANADATTCDTNETWIAPRNECQYVIVAHDWTDVCG